MPSRIVIVGGPSRSSCKFLIYKDPGTQNSGVFVSIKDMMEYKEIDFDSVKNRIVEQAYDSAFRMTEEQTQRLIKDKFDRAREMHRAMTAMPCWHTDR